MEFYPPTLWEAAPKQALLTALLAGAGSATGIVMSFSSEPQTYNIYRSHCMQQLDEYTCYTFTPWPAFPVPG